MENIMKPLAGTALDYSQNKNWMFYGNTDEAVHDIDVFFLYPTSVSADVRTEVCEDIMPMRRNAHISYLLAADTFASFANMYAPYYRQQSAVSVMKNPTADGLQTAVAGSVTRTDVYASLDYYFENYNEGRPYILAGHSQGSCCLKIVMSEYMQIHPEYADRMIACYAIGYYFPHSWFDANPHVRKASGETDTGVLITWNTEGPGGTKYSLPLGNNDGFCINPLNWRTDETPADITQNKGSLSVDAVAVAEVFGFVVSGDAGKIPDGFDFSSDYSNSEKADKTRSFVVKYTEGVADAVIDKKRGALITSTYTAYIPDNPMFGDRSCHFEDWSLFSVNIRENARKRAEAFLGRGII